MDSTADWAAELAKTLGDQLTAGFQLIPGILGAIAILIVGWLLARLLRRGVRSAASASNRVLTRMLPSGLLGSSRVSPMISTLLGEAVFWSIILLSVTAATRIAGLSAISGWLNRIAVHLPNVIAALAILIVGYLLSIFLRERLASDLSSPGRSERNERKELIARGAQSTVLGVAIIIGLDQLGIDVALLIALMTIAAAAIALTFSASISLGARSYMRDLIGLRSLRHQLAPGLTIRVNGIDGRILEITPSQVLLETTKGKALVPGHLVSEGVTIVLEPEGSEEAIDE